MVGLCVDGIDRQLDQRKSGHRKFDFTRLLVFGIFLDVGFRSYSLFSSYPLPDPALSG